MGGLTWEDPGEGMPGSYFITLQCQTLLFPTDGMPGLLLVVSKISLSPLTILKHFDRSKMYLDRKNRETFIKLCLKKQININML